MIELVKLGQFFELITDYAPFDGTEPDIEKRLERLGEVLGPLGDDIEVVDSKRFEQHGLDVVAIIVGEKTDIIPTIYDVLILEADAFRSYRTTNVPAEVGRSDLIEFFESVCGELEKLSP